MRKWWIAGVLSLGAVMAWSGGCSAMGAASTGLMIGKNLGSNKLGIRVFLDGQEAKRNELKQAATGYSRWKISEPVSTSPKLKFEFKEPDALGRITMVVVNIHQKFEADYSHQAEYTIHARSQEPTAQMKPNTTYDLGALPGEFKIMDYKNAEVSRVDLKPGMQYLMNVVVRADASETAQIYFETK